jgi:hypothetical protein
MIYGTDSGTTDRLLKIWKEVSGGYVTRPDVIDQLISHSGDTAVEAAILNMGLQQKSNPVGLDTQLDRVQKFLGR